jgi:hypothetical protein
MTAPIQSMLTRLADTQATAAHRLAEWIDGNACAALCPEMRTELRTIALSIATWSDLTNTAAGEIAARERVPTFGAKVWRRLVEGVGR